jgi:hypothetical protein
MFRNLEFPDCKLSHSVLRHNFFRIWIFSENKRNLKLIAKFHSSKLWIFPIVIWFTLYSETAIFSGFVFFSGNKQILKQITNFHVSKPRIFLIVNWLILYAETAFFPDVWNFPKIRTATSPHQARNHLPSYHLRNLFVLPLLTPIRNLRSKLLSGKKETLHGDVQELGVCDFSKGLGGLVTAILHENTKENC